MSSVESQQTKVQKYEQTLDAYIRDEKFSKATKTLNHFLKTETEVFDKEPISAEVADIYQKLGEVALAQHEYTQAINHFSKAQFINVQVRGASHQITTLTQALLARAQELSGVKSPLPKETIVTEPSTPQLKKDKSFYYRYTRKMSIF